MTISTQLQKALIGVPAIALGFALWHEVEALFEPAIWAAEVMYAEDLDRAGGAPDWFWPWHVAMRNGLSIEASMYLLGCVLLVLGALNLKSVRLTGWVLAAQVSATIVCITLAANLSPLYQAFAASSMSWGEGAPAFSKLSELQLATRSSWHYVALAALSVACTAFVRRKSNNSLQGRPRPELTR